MKHRIQMRAVASALAACICLSALPGALAAEPGRVKAPGRTEMEHGPVSTEFASTRLAFAVSDPVRNNDGTITLDVAYADSEGVRREGHPHRHDRDRRGAHYGGGQSGGCRLHH